MAPPKPPIKITGNSLIYRYGNLPDFVNVNSLKEDLDFYREGFIYKRDHELQEADQKPNKTIQYTLKEEKGPPPTITIIFQIKYLGGLPMANFLRQVKYNDESIKTKKFVWFKDPDKQKEIYQRQEDVQDVPNMSTLGAAYQSLLIEVFEEYINFRLNKDRYTYLANIAQDVGVSMSTAKVQKIRRAAFVSMNKLKIKRGAQNKIKEKFQTWRNKYRNTKFPTKPR